jgi:hypothetical protein
VLYYNIYRDIFFGAFWLFLARNLFPNISKTKNVRKVIKKIMLTNWKIFQKFPDHNFFYGLTLGHFQKSPSTFWFLTFINVRNRKPVPDFWEFFCVSQNIYLKYLKKLWYFSPLKNVRNFTRFYSFLSPKRHLKIYALKITLRLKF